MASWKKVKSIQELMLDITKTLENDSKMISIALAEDIRNILYLYTQSWYESHEPREYERTYQFINSLTVRSYKKEQVGAYVEVGFDPEKMFIAQNNGFMQHIDRINLSNIINDGWEVYGKEIQGSDALNKTISYLESNGFFKSIKEELKKHGYKLI